MRIISFPSRASFRGAAVLLALVIGFFVGGAQPAILEKSQEGGAPSATPSFEQALGASLDLLSSPAEFRLNYSTIRLGAKTQYAEEMRAFLRSHGEKSAAFVDVKAHFEVIRAEVGPSSLSSPFDDSSIYVGGPDEYFIGQGGLRFSQRSTAEPAVTPPVLWTPEVSLVLHQEIGRLDFVESSQALDLRTVASFVSPLPISPAGREHWFSKPLHPTDLVGGERRLSLRDANHCLTIKCAREAPFLPVAAWIQSLHSASQQTVIGSFISYQVREGAIVPSVIYSVRENSREIRIDEYSICDLVRTSSDADITLQVRRGTTFLDRTGGANRVYPTLEEVPTRWRELIDMVD